MIIIDDFTPLVGRTVKRLLVVIWPPFREADMLDVDMSIALEFDVVEDVLFHIEIDKSDGWTPVISKAEFGDFRQWRDFRQRIKDWMSGEIHDPLQLEVFDVTHDITFKYIVSREIIDIECVTIQNEFNPFAIKLIFPDDYIILSPISDGTTIETAIFNKTGNLKIHESLGDLEFISIANCK